MLLSPNHYPQSFVILLKRCGDCYPQLEDDIRSYMLSWCYASINEMPQACPDMFSTGNCPNRARAWKAHVSSDKHIKKAKSSGANAKIGPESVTVVPGHKFCGICNRHVQNDGWKSHVRGRKHQASVNTEVFTSGLDKAKVDKGGVTVTGNVDFGIVSPEAGKHPKKHQLTIRTTVSHGKIGLAEFYTVAAKTRRKTPSP
ncbi:hypothetical protein MPER_05361, partial [Moniliophthora perniciosa FA553]